MKPNVSVISKPVITILVLSFALAVTFQNCEQPKYNIKGTLSDVTEPVAFVANVVPEEVICDPDAYKANLKGGLVAELYYMTSGQSKSASSVTTFFDPKKAVKSSKQIYFSQVNTAPQYFNRGFITQSGDKVQDDSGKDLVEWFALKYFADIMIMDAADEGEYEFSSISDDGHIFEAQIDGVWTRILNEDGLHSPRWGCSTNTITLKKDVPVPIRVYYYQGPASHIANMLHWRKVSAAKPVGKDPACGTDAASAFNLSTSVPYKQYNDFLARGWEVVPSKVFFLPGTTTNPCVDQ